MADVGVDRRRGLVLAGVLSMRRTEKLAVAVTKERSAFLADSLPALLRLNRQTTDDTAFDEALRYWCARVDEHLAPRRDQPHQLVASQRLFGGGEIHADLSPSAFLNVMAAVEAFTQDPDPAHAPHQRTLAERRADDLDEALDLADQDPDEPIDPLDVIRRRIRRAELHRRRRTHRRLRPKSGVTVNVHLDLRTLSDTRDIDDLDDLVLRGEGWHVTKQAAERLLCDSALVATLFAGKNKVLDANDAAEQFTRRQRRALAARDGRCVFPSCQRAPRFCDAHHLHWREHDGPTRSDNAALLCRFHHRLVHEYRWSLSVDDAGNSTATDRHGTTWTGRPARLARDGQPRAPGRATAKTTG